MKPCDVHLIIGNNISAKQLLELLEQIDDTGSINKAVEAVGMSYRSGLNLLNKTESTLKVKLIQRQSGGQSGGGSTLTPEGLRLMGRLKFLQRDVAGQFNTIVGDAAPKEKKLTIASTTEPIGTGLLDVLEQAFFQESGIFVYHIGAGSGQALDMARAGRVDCVLTHAPDLEKEFVLEGWGVEAMPFMKDQFVLVGPSSDPAKVAEAGTVKEALERISNTGSLFVSRGDRSGTHMKEMSLWKKHGVDPLGQPWYMKAAPLSGNRGVLAMAEEKKAYALVDLASFTIGYHGNGLRVLLEQEDELENVFSVIPVRRTMAPVNQQDAEHFAQWLRGPKAKEIIAEFGKSQWGKPLFVPLKAALNMVASGKKVQDLVP